MSYYKSLSSAMQPMGAFWSWIKRVVIFCMTMEINYWHCFVIEMETKTQRWTKIYLRSPRKLEAEPKSELVAIFHLKPLISH